MREDAQAQLLFGRMYTELLEHLALPSHWRTESSRRSMRVCGGICYLPKRAVHDTREAQQAQQAAAVACECGATPGVCVQHLMHKHGGQAFEGNDARVFAGCVK